MRDSKIKIALYFISSILLLGCSSQITIAKLNKPAYKNFKKIIKHDKIEAKKYIEGDPDIVKKIVDEDKYFFERQIEIRNRIVDSLSLLKKEDFIIIDSNSDNNGQRVEFNYFFYDEKIIYVWFKREENVSNGDVFVKYTPKIENISVQSFEKNLNGLYDIYKVFKNSTEIPPQLESGSERTSYLVTVVKDKQIKYYSVSGAWNYKITKLD